MQNIGENSLTDHTKPNQEVKGSAPAMVKLIISSSYESLHSFPCKAFLICEFYIWRNSVRCGYNL